MLSWELWNLWQLRAFLICGLAVIATDWLSDGILDLGSPTSLNIYLFISGLYFAASPQSRVATRRQEQLVRFLFPGAFVTTLLPIYALVLFLIRSGKF